MGEEVYELAPAGRGLRLWRVAQSLRDWRTCDAVRPRVPLPQGPAPTKCGCESQVPLPRATAPTKRRRRGPLPASGVLSAWVVIVLFMAPSGAQEWVEIMAGNEAPPSRMSPSIIYEPMGHRMIIFGGAGPNGDLDDMWALDLREHRWSEIAPAGDILPPARATHNGVYDPVGHRMVIWAGQEKTRQRAFFNDVWSFDLGTDTWTELKPPDPLPLNRYGTAAVFDPLARDLVTFAGFTDNGRFDDTWRFDVDGGIWTDVSPGEGPHERCLHSASYDALEHRMIMYGGQQAGALEDIWAFDLNENTWTELTPEQGPPGRFFPVHVYDPINHRSIVFGGNRSGDLQQANDVWAFDLKGNSWEELEVGGTPPIARERAAGIFIPSEGRMIVYGGAGGGRILGDTWALNDLAPPLPTAVDGKSSLLPAAFILEQNYPNPFNPETAIRYELPAAAKTALEIYDVLGRRVHTLVEGAVAVGSHTIAWDGTDDRGQRVGAGVYVYRLRVEGTVLSRKLILLK